jgi:hypothetical protein
MPGLMSTRRLQWRIPAVADRVIDEFTAVPGHDEMTPMAVGMIYAFLAGDTYTGIMISREVDQLGESHGHVADTFAVMAAAMLVEACGGQVNARALADRWARKIATRQARVVQARKVKASLSQPGSA